MNGTLKVTPAKLRTGASNFSSCGTQVRSLTSQMTSKIDNLSSIWSGEAATAYKNKFHQLDDDIQRFNKMIQEHVKDLQDMASVYEKAENEARNASSSLPTNPID